ncbi:MAG: multiheme c-type cytochrome, partial [Pirellulaceae bacterium]
RFFPQVWIPPMPWSRLYSPHALFALIAPLVLIGAAWGLFSQTKRVDAVPHTITPGDYPYDEDWPDVFLVMSNKCAGCHRPNSDRVDLSTYEALLAAQMNGKPVIKPGDPHGSPLWQVIAWHENPKPGSPLPKSPEMPPEKHEWLTLMQQETLFSWIERGALQFKLPGTCNTAPITEIDFPSAKQCQDCHPKQYDEWSRSMHAYAQHSPVFEAFNLTLMERTSGTLGTFCSRCHTPIGTALGENGNRRNIHRSRISMEGITCIACHRRSTKHYKASGRVPVEPGQLHDSCMYGPFDDSVSGPHTGTHPAEGMPYLKSSQFCGECHDVTNPEGIRLEEAFSEWQNSPAADEGITCQSCHMGPVQGVPCPDHQRPMGYAATVPGIPQDQMPLRHLTDHTFAGPDYSLLPDTEFPEKLDWMYEKDYRDWEKLSEYERETLTALRKKNRHSLNKADEKRYELLKNAAEIAVYSPQTARSGQQIGIHVDVTSKFKGHSFPTGFTAERQAWVSITVCDPEGNIVFQSGDLDANGDLRDEHSHAVLAGKTPHDRYLLNFQNKFTVLTANGTERSVVLSVNRHLSPLNVLRPATGVSASFGRPPGFRIAKGSLAPLSTQGQTYPVKLPHCAGPCQVTVRLNFRHLPPTLLDHVGTPHLKHLLEVVVLDQWQGTIEVQP